MKIDAKTVLWWAFLAGIGFSLGALIIQALNAFFGGVLGVGRVV